QAMLVYTPYFDSKTSWYNGEAYFYRDSYAVYTNDSNSTHLSWVLHDAAGNPCYIPYGSPYDQFAADVGNQAFRNDYVNFVVSKLNAYPRYGGVFVDDVNLDLSRVSCGHSSGSGNNHAPIDPRTGQAMTNANWRLYFVQFLEQLRAALPNKKIVHNAVWYIV